jgi:ADP-ribose pyrophosphatase YjhB (NUDIX family)
MKEDSFAFFGPTENHFVPKGGFCISVFAVLRQGASVLLVKPREHERWKEWAPNWRIYGPARLAADMEKWRFPSAYVKEGEPPEETLKRVAGGQLGLGNFSYGSPTFLNFYEPSRRYPGEMHWDYCFVFEVKTEETVGEQPWFAEVAFMDAGSAPALGSAQGEILDSLRGSKDIARSSP